MLTGIDLNETMDFVSQFDKSETKTVFKISVIPSKIQARAAKLAGIDGDGSMDMMMEVFRFGVKNIVNFVDKSGAPILFETIMCHVGNEAFSVVSDKVMNRLHIKLILEVGSKILEISNLKDDEIKN